MKTPLLIGIATSGLMTLSSCLIGVVRTREYVPVQDKRIELVDGWFLEPEIFAYKNIAGADTKIWSFTHLFTFAKIRAQGDHISDTIRVIEVDTIMITLRDVDSVLILPLKSPPTWVSNVTDKEMHRAAIYAVDNDNANTEYPPGTHSIILSMHIKSYPAKHYWTAKQWDSLVIDHSRVLRDTIIEVPFKLREKSYPGIATGDM